MEDRSAERATGLILPEFGFGLARGVGEEVIGIQFVVAQEFERAAVELVRARAGGGVDNHPGGVAVLRREVVGLHLELGYRVHGGRIGDAGASNASGVRGGVVVGSVQHDLVGRKPPTASDKGQVRAHPYHRVGIAGQKPKSEGIAPIERQFQNLGGVNHLADGRGAGFQQRRHSGDLHDFPHFSGLECDLNVRVLIHPEIQARDDPFLEPCRFGGDRVASNREERGTEQTLFVGLSQARLACLHVGDVHGRPSDYGSRRVLDGDVDGARADLTPGNGREQ